MIEFLKGDNTVPVLIIGFIVFGLLAYGQAQYIIRDKIKQLKTEYKAKVSKYIDDTILTVEEITTSNCKDIMKARWEEIGKCQLGEEGNSCPFLQNHFPMELSRLLAILHSGFERNKLATIQHVTINGFHDLTGNALTNYKKEAGTDIYEITQRTLRVKGIEELTLIQGTEGVRFSKDSAIAFYSEVIDEVIRLENERDEAINNLNKKLRITQLFINIVKGVVDA